MCVCAVLQAEVGGGGGSRTRIFYGDHSQTMVDQDTDYSGRIEVVSDRRATRLVLPEAALADEKDFFCQINGMAAGSVEGKTHLRVFGQSTAARCQTSLCLPTILHAGFFCSPAPPQAPVIEGVLAGVPVTREGPSKVGPLHICRPAWAGPDGGGWSQTNCGCLGGVL